MSGYIFQIEMSGLTDEEFERIALAISDGQLANYIKVGCQFNFDISKSINSAITNAMATQKITVQQGNNNISPAEVVYPPTPTLKLKEDEPILQDIDLGDIKSPIIPQEEEKPKKKGRGVFSFGKQRAKRER